MQKTKTLKRVLTQIAFRTQTKAVFNNDLSEVEEGFVALLKRGKKVVDRLTLVDIEDYASIGSTN